MRTSWSVIAILAALVVLASAFQGALRSTPDAGEDDGELLQGTWLREYSDQGTTIRRVLDLEPSGAFHEAVRVVQPSGGVARFAHEGTWHYDGTNLKRHYTLVNGKPPSRLNVPFATFQVTFDSPNEFTGVDHVHKVEVRYERVPAGTEP
ncbi:hypothetical protein HHL11_10730 [Ramlibacter sp. G-1-2-2]|uniref:Lipocalin-like domain-containing protein n=1 Tax=Ramlibacter agri TaxID=2728837 RepID=A0A848GZU4_9BURK|nr:hypothetical protein [Ramlibacter agri]NML44226.1 hypothetical protein [Ramlibacter agri]